MRLFQLCFLSHRIPALTESVSIPPLLSQISVSAGFWVNNKITQAGTCSDDFFFINYFYFVAWKTFSPLFHPPRQGVQRDMFANRGRAALSTPTLATLREGAARKLAGEHLCKYSFGIC